MLPNSTNDPPRLGGRRRQIAACACVSLLALLLICVSLGSGALLRSSRVADDSRASGLGEAQIAHARRPPSLTPRRAVGARREEPASQPTASPTSEPASTLVSDPPPAPAPVVSPAAVPVGEPPASDPAPTGPEPTPPSTPEPSDPPPSEPPVGPAEPLPETPPRNPPPQIEPPQGPPPVAAAPLFNGDSIGDFAQVQSAPRAISEVPDPLGSGETVFKLTVNDKDVYPVTPTENPRAQALSPSLIEPGDEFWLETKFMLPQDFPTVPGWMSLVSIYGPPFQGSSPWQVEVSGDEINWQRNDTYRYDVPWRMPLAKGRWVSILLHERFASDGWVEMWVDGEKVTFFPAGNYNPANHQPAELLEMATMDSTNNGGANSAKIMQYREEGMFSSASVYFGALKLGESRASVEG
jgi:hypothetical protein